MIARGGDRGERPVEILRHLVAHRVELEADLREREAARDCVERRRSARRAAAVDGRAGEAAAPRDGETGRAGEAKKFATIH